MTSPGRQASIRQAPRPCVLVGEPLHPSHVFRADINADGRPDGEDMAPFVGVLLGP